VNESEEAMRSASCCRSFLAASTLALGGCADTLAGPGPVGRAQQAPLVIEGFPATQQIRMGENVLLSLKDVPSDVESIRWGSSDPRIASVTVTPSVSLCGSACAWLRGEASGGARIEVRVCYVDGSCATVQRARVGEGSGDTTEIDTDVSVLQ
jgi:hypothetical protein